MGFRNEQDCNNYRACNMYISLKYEGKVKYSIEFYENPICSTFYAPSNDFLFFYFFDSIKLGRLFLLNMFNIFNSRESADSKSA